MPAGMAAWEHGDLPGSGQPCITYIVTYRGW